MEPQSTPPVMDVMAPPPPPAAPDPVEEAFAKDDPKPETQPKPLPADKKTEPQAAKEPKNGVTLAIVTTVIIVLSLAALATYAYIQQK